MNWLKESFLILFESLRVAFIIVYHYLSLKLRLIFSKKEEHNTVKGKALRKFLLSMGPIYIKAGQVLATQSGFLSEEINEELKPLFSNVKPSKPGYVKKVMKETYKGKLESVFQSFEFTPLAVGSIAQVHKAVLQDGTEVAVKVVKENVKKKINTGIKLIAFVLNALDKMVRSLRELDMPGHFEEMRYMLQDQCNMTMELNNQNEVAKNFKNHAYLRIPKTYEAYSNDQILVMDFISGISGEHVSELSFSKPILANRLQDSFYTMAYFHGVYHLDPHPGNIIFKESGEIFLIDFGLVGRMDIENKWALSAFFYACIRQEWQLAINRLLNTFVINKDFIDKNYEAYSREQEAVLKKHFLEEKNTWSTLGFFDDTNKLLQKYKSRVTTKFSQFGIAFLTGEGFVTMVDPNIDIWANARKFADRSSPYVSDEVRAKFDRFFNEFIPKSMASRMEIAKSLVAPTHLDRYVLPSTYPLIVETAKGSHITDIDGNEYIDLSCGYGPHILGYAHPSIGKAIAEGFSKGNVNALGNVAEFKFAQKLVSAFPEGNKVILCNSGTESVLMAFRLSRAFTGRSKVAKFEGHYHGFTDEGMVSSWFQFKGNRYDPQPVEGCPGAVADVVDNTIVLQYGRQASLDAVIANRSELACVICEPMPSSLGVFNKPFLEKLRIICDQYGILLIYDEVVSGFRTTYGGVQHIIGVYPDITCLGKIIGGGLPCGAVVGKKEVIEKAKTSEDPFKDLESKTFVGGTLSGNALTASAGYAMLDYLSEHKEIYQDLQEKTKWLTTKLTEVADRKSIPNSIVGNYSIFALTFSQNKPELFRDRIYATNSKANMALSYYIRKHKVYLPELHTMMLSTAHTYEDLNTVVEAFDKALDEMIEDKIFTA